MSPPSTPPRPRVRHTRPTHAARIRSLQLRFSGASSTGPTPATPGRIVGAHARYLAAAPTRRREGLGRRRPRRRGLAPSAEAAKGRDVRLWKFVVSPNMGRLDLRGHTARWSSSSSGPRTRLEWRRSSTRHDTARAPGRAGRRGRPLEIAFAYLSGGSKRGARAGDSGPRFPERARAPSAAARGRARAVHRDRSSCSGGRRPRPGDQRGRAPDLAT